MNGSVDPNRVVKTIMKMSEYMYERYKLLKKKNDNNILNCNYDHFFFIKDYSIRLYSIFILFLNLASHLAGI